MSAFMDCAARIQTGFTVFTPVHTAIVMGRKEAKAVTMMTVWSPFPEPDDGDGRPGEGGNGEQHREQGDEERLPEGEAPHQDADADAHDRSDREREGQPPRRGEGVPEERTLEEIIELIDKAQRIIEEDMVELAEETRILGRSGRSHQGSGDQLPRPERDGADGREQIAHQVMHPPGHDLPYDQKDDEGIEGAKFHPEGCLDVFLCFKNVGRSRPGLCFCHRFNPSLEVTSRGLIR
ncbi:hypothetical protein ACFLQ0_00045 [Nitrospinota bacterium]